MNNLQVNDNNNFEQCMKCSVCTAYCPVTLVNPQFPGPKQSGPDGERYRLRDIDYFDRTLNYCLNCKRCEVACPSDVKIGDIIQVVRFKHAVNPPKFRNRLLADTHRVGSLVKLVAPVVNAALKSAPVKQLLDSKLQIDRRRTLPHYASKTFRGWYNESQRKKQQAFNKKVIYYHGCYVNYNFPRLGKDLVTILNAVGIGVELIKEKCCGMPLIMNGLVDKATRYAKFNINSIATHTTDNKLVITTSPTCTMTLRDEYTHILGLDNLNIRDNIFLATRYLYDLIDDNKIVLKFKPGTGRKVAYHTSCHMQKLGWAIYSSKLLSLIPGSKTIVLDSMCCGLAGTHGFKKENYDDSQKIGQPLFRRITKISPDIVATDCESCKWQLETSTPFEIKHPLSIIADSLDIEATKKANGVK